MGAYKSTEYFRDGEKVFPHQPRKANEFKYRMQYQ